MLCEKPFTATFEEAELLFAEASRRKLFISEAMWTRCIPSVEKIREVIDSGEIGVVRTVTGVFGRHLAHVPRVARPELAGGGLLDLGIYPLNFAMMFLGEDYTSAKSFITLTPEGVDAQAVIVLEYADGRVANVMSSMTSDMGEPGAVCGTEGQIRIQSMLKSQSFTLERRGVPQHEFDCSFDFNGYEYMLRSVAKAVSENRYECPEMKHESTLMAMKVMDDARRNGRVVRPGPEY